METKRPAINLDTADKVGRDYGGAGDGYASDSQSDYDQQQSSSSGASSPEETKTDFSTQKGNPISTRGGRSAHSVSFSRSKSRMTEKRVRYDGEEVMMVTLDTQTDWDWVEDAETSGKIKIIIPAKEASSETPSASTGTKVKSILVKPESRETTSRPRTELGVSSAGDSRADTDYSPFSLQPNDEFGIPLLEISSTSEDSSDEETVKKKKPPPRVSLPSVGPPQILKYVRESELVDLTVDLNKQSEVTPAHIDLESLGDLPVDEDGNPLGMFSGPCEFCNKPILPIPTLEMQQMKAPADLYCCEDYREFIQFATSTALRMEQEAQKATKMISVKPHSHHGSKQARRAAKERAVERMRQREIARRQQEALGSQANFFSSRQMKTINYQLSSQRCLEEGWTLRPPSPLEPEEEVEIFVPEPLHPAMIASGNIRDRQMIEKYYPNGEKFLTIFPDGTGNVFYPSGYLAMVISSVCLGQYTFIVLDNCPEQSILAVFDPHGFATMYYLNGNIKLYYDQMGGLELDAYGGKRKRWHWKDQDVHVHAPPFQPICLQLNHHFSVRLMSQEAIALTFMASKRSCRFSVGARLKLVAPQLLPKTKEIDQNQLFIDERAAQVENILNKVSMLLKFPKSPKLDKILPPIHVTSKMQRTEQLRKELSASVAGSKERKPAKEKTTFPAVRVTVS